MTILPYAQTGTDLVHWAEEASHVHKMAQALASTSFVPKAMQGRPDEIAAQILYGREVNMSPMVALQQIHVIEGRPSLSALSMRGMAQAAGVKFRLDDSTETRCKYSALAPGDSNWTVVTWTMDRARKLGVADKANWKKQPQAMLVARATSELCRLVAAPLFLGLSYSTEELRDGSDDTSALYESTSIDDASPKTSTAAPADRTPTPSQTESPRTMRRDPVKATASVDEPEQPAIRAAPVREPAPARTPPAEVGYDTRNLADSGPGAKVDRPDMVTADTRKALMATFNDAKMPDRVTRLAYVSDLLGREVQSVNQITEPEGKAVLVRLHTDFPRETRDSEWDAAVVQVAP
jgi:hypothetical protein